MQAFQKGFPGLKALMTFGHGMPWQEIEAGKRPLGECSCGLLAPAYDAAIRRAASKPVATERISPTAR